MLTFALSAAVLFADRPDPYRDKKQAWLAARAAAAPADEAATARVREQYAARIADAEARKRTAEAEVKRLKGMKVPANVGMFKKYGDALDATTADLSRIQEEQRKAEAAVAVRRLPGVVPPADLTVGFFGKVNAKDEPANGPFQVVRVIDANTAAVEWGDETVWVEHTGKGFAAGQAYTFPGWVYATGTKIHTTRLGATRTIPVVKLVD